MHGKLIKMVNFKLGNEIWRWINQHDANVGQRKILSSRQESNPWPSEHRAGSEGHGFDSCRGLRIFLCSTLVSCWLIHLHSYMHVVRGLIGSLDCLYPLWVARVTPVLVFQHSTENCPMSTADYIISKCLIEKTRKRRKKHTWGFCILFPKPSFRVSQLDRHTETFGTC